MRAAVGLSPLPTAPPAGDDARIGIVIPAYQPTWTLVRLVDELQPLLRQAGLAAPIVVVDDGSMPSCGSIFAALAERPGIVIARHAINLGKGEALQTGINHLLARAPDLIGVVTADADGQHLPQDIIAVARQLRESPQALVLGTRQFDAGVPLRSRFGNIATRGVFRLLARKRLSDTQTGLRGLPSAIAKRMLRMHYPGYELELALLYAEVRRGTPILEAPIASVYERGNPTSHFNPIFDSARIYFVFLRYSALAFTTAILDYILFLLLYFSTGKLFLAVVCGRLLIGGLYFTLARRNVFLAHGDAARQAHLFATLLAASALATYGLTTVLVLVFGQPLPLAKPLSDLLLFFANFAFQRVFIFPRED